MKRVSLAVEPRKVLGKEVKKLRRDGIIPANIYGKDYKSQSVQLTEKEFTKAYKEVHETGLVDLKLGDKTTPVLIKHVQTDYANTPLHADFYVVNLKEKVRAEVRLELVGEPRAVTDKLGLLMHILSNVEVEALPTDLPEKIEVNVQHLKAVDEQITVADLKAPEGVTILSETGQVVAKIAELVTKAAAAEAAAEAAAAEAAKAETAEGATEEEKAPVAEGDLPAQTGKPTETPAPVAPKEEPKA